MAGVGESGSCEISAVLNLVLHDMLFFVSEGALKCGLTVHSEQNSLAAWDTLCDITDWRRSSI